MARLRRGSAALLNDAEARSGSFTRDLVETVAVFRDPGRPGGVAVEIAGRPNALLGEKAYPNQVKGVWGKVVAKEGFEPPTPGL